MNSENLNETQQKNNKLNETLSKAIDGLEYNILESATKQATQITGLSCEIGLREGGATHKIMKIFKELNAQRPHIAIDPFGNINYEHWETKSEKLDYTNKMKNQALINLHEWCLLNDYEFIFLPLEDTEFFKRFKDGVPIYNETKKIWNEYALIFFDGPHTQEKVKQEINFFSNKTQIGGLWVFDDINQYPHMQELNDFIISLGFQIFEKGKYKISYIKKS